MYTINIGKDFSNTPAGRTIALDGNDSGEAFREQHLKPALRAVPQGQKVEIILDDGVVSYGSSFISEAFGALVRSNFMTAEELKSKLSITHQDKSRYMRMVAGKIIKSIDENAQP